MDRKHQTQQIIVLPSSEPYYDYRCGHKIRPERCVGKPLTKCLLIFFTIMFLLAGSIFTKVGYTPQGYCGVDFRPEERREEERNLKIYRIVGPIVLAIGGVLLCTSIFYCRVKRKRNQGQVISGATTCQMGTSQGGTDTATSSFQYPSNTKGHGKSTANIPGPYPNNPPPPAAGLCSLYPVGQVYPPAQQPYPPQDRQGAQQYQTDIPPPQSYGNVIDQSKPSPGAPPLEYKD